MSATPAQRTEHTAPAISLAELLDSKNVAWAAANRRRAVPSAAATLTTTTPSRLLALPEWPGSGRIQTGVDVLPMVVIPDMPPAQYPQYIRPLSGYTLAELAVRMPQLANQVWEHDIAIQVMVAVAARAGVWASLNKTPEAQESITGRAVRWSERTGGLVVRPASVDDDSALWRHFLASSPGLPRHAAEICPAIAGVAPLLFLAGSALLLQAGEVYAMRYLEQEITKHMRATLSREAFDMLNLESPAMWDTLTAAAIGGFSVSVTRAIAIDPAYITCAYMRCDNSPRLEAQLTRIAAASSHMYWGFPADTGEQSHSGVRTAAASADDAASVADTEAEYESEVQMPTSSAVSGEATPIQGRQLDNHDELVEAIRKIKPMTPAIGSIAKMPLDNDTVIW